MVSPRFTPIGFALALLLGAGGLAFGYARGEPSAAGWLCRAGLPNPTVPKRYRGALHGDRCQLYGRKVRITGIWAWDGFERSGFYPYRFAEEGLARHGLTWPGISLESDGRSDPRNLMAPFDKGAFEGGQALVTLEGWPALGEGRFGHLGAHDRQILIDRIVAAAPPPEPTEADYRRWRRLLGIEHAS